PVLAKHPCKQRAAGEAVNNALSSLVCEFRSPVTFPTTVHYLFRHCPFTIMSTSTSSASIPLTTIFTPPASCFSIITYDGSYFWQGELFQTGDPDCYPTLFSSIHESFYSPGICPQGWISASSVTGTAALVTNTAESNALCCP